MFDLIEKYESYPCLYNTMHQDYHDRNLRNKALGEIATNLDVTGIHKHVARHVKSVLLVRKFLLTTEEDVSKKYVEYTNAVYP